MDLASRNMGGWRRSHRLGELRASDVGKTVILMGWIHKRRDHGNLIFVDLRDGDGITQVVLDPTVSPSVHGLGDQLRQEFVIAVSGEVRLRPEGMVNSNLPTGQIEVLTKDLKILNSASVLPFPVQEGAEASEALRLKYRYLDLRKHSVRQPLVKRIHFVRAMRKALEEKGFLDIETPYLYKSTPEGAREFLVPSRVHAGQFYALPQSPQLFKQILMIAGMDRYYQVVKCFRDEDLRADRQPEFTQIDCEMSFVDQELVMETFESVLVRAMDLFEGTKLPNPLPRLTFAEAMEDYGCDKPDTRFDLKLRDITQLVSKVEFKVFAEAISTGGIVNAIVIKDQGDQLSRKDLDGFQEVARHHGAGGLAWARVKDGSGVESWQSPIAKFLDDATINGINSKLSLKSGDLVLFGAGSYETVKASLCGVRLALGKRLELMDPRKLNFLWVTDFPLLEKDPGSGRIKACHHPFTMPHPDDIHMLESDPLKVRACAYDLVLNGNEVAGGSIRIHDQRMQALLFKTIGLTIEEANEKFGFLLEALQFGAPPHGGMAFGLDRLSMIITGCEAIRDVIAFPKTAKATCLMTGAPSEVGIDSLRDLHIRVQTLKQ